MTELKEIHDRWLENKPESASHDSVTCTLCPHSDSSTGGKMSDKTFSEDEAKSLVAAAVAEAVKPLNEKISEFEGSKSESEFDAKIAAAVAEADAKTEEVQKLLDAATLEAESAKTERDAITTWLDEEKTKVDAEAELATLRTERTAQVAEVAAFPEQYVKDNTDRWASMAEEAFTALLADYKAAGVKPAEGKGIPAHTSLNASRDESDKSGANATREVMNFRAAGVDVRNI